MTGPFDLGTLARVEVRSLASYNAGLSIEAVQRRYGVSRIAKLGSNENPLGPSPAVVQALADTATTYALYPDAECTELRAALATRLGLDGKHLVFGNGSEDLLGIISRVFLDHGDEVVTVLPSFGLHILYPKAAGAEVRGVPMKPDNTFDVDALLAALTPHTRLLMFSSPSNPVGCTLSAKELQRILDALPRHTLLVFDEAYHEYARHAEGYPDCLTLLEASGKPYVLLRTLSKAYALAGLRVGYGIVSDPLLANLIDRLRTPFNVNRAAQIAAVAALEDEAHLKAGLALITRERTRVDQALRNMGLNPAPSLANFLFFSTPYEADVISEGLLCQGVIVKPWREVGYTRYVRVSIGSPEDNDLFLQALSHVLNDLS
ncbi:histidinol-phosphate aminotransferase [Pseudomonas duriflava]|uniref:Histidinol-phosphate aminotransferase n=1 Tax=Pseudomonas duriflava TaxID=459528 RepID=A0A562QFS1_9PSED|nr:histidinol-phosphate transaminase [Pseudomonas duriflava]TWI55598.1 histidinol-phosphate aminotransferase [Pseudomonas duriflava]